MALPEDLFPGSYDGIQFLIESSTTSGRKKYVLKTFPNSTKQSIENLKGLPDTYNITAILTGDDYIQRRNALVLRLKREEFGILIHPFYGRIENVLPVEYQTMEETSALGNSRINIVFEVNDDGGIPVEADTSLSSVVTGNTSMIAACSESYNNSFLVSEQFPNNFVAAVIKMDNLVTAFRDNTSFLSVAAAEIDSFNLLVGELSNSVTQLVKDPTAFTTSVNGIFASINGLYSTAKATFQVFKRFFDFGDNDITIQPTTTARIERTQNNAVTNQYVQAQALGYSYARVSEITFVSVEELDEFSNELEVQYQKLINNLTVNNQDPSIGLSSEAKSSLTDLRVIVNDFFDRQRLTTQQLTDIITVELPARVIAYQYYADSNLGESIAELNDELGNPSFLSGSIRILVS